METPFRDRRDAGRLLAEKLGSYANRPDLIVLGLPRGGVPVAYEVAQALNAPLDVFLVRKLGVPGHEELAMGAIATGGIRVLNRDVTESWRIPEAAIAAVEAAERRELARRERLYRGTRPPPDVRDKVVILVDDGLATGSTMRAAAEALRRMGPKRIVAAVPVAAAATCEALQDVVDEVVCGITPDVFYAVGLWYEDFSPTTDEEVRELLRRAEERNAMVATQSPRVDRARDQIARLRDLGQPTSVDASGALQLLDLVGDARFVLIGEASHGTDEFYRLRAEVTKRLIEERGFHAVAAEADWPDAFRVNRYVRARSDDPNPDAALSDFRRFPQWMWRNTVVLDFVGWLRSHNDAQPREEAKAGVYGLDLYSLNSSIESVLEYLEKVDPEAARRARARYSCFDHFGDDAQAYGYATSLGVAESCEDEVVQQLIDLRRRAAELAQRDGHVAEDEFFNAEMNARLARDAERYYRSMFRGRVSSWNLRDRHMAETLEALAAHVDRRVGAGRSKIVVWAHNSHLGDARATAMGESGELNLGQLVRERWGRDACLVGFSTYHGTVTAASDWGAPAERKRVRTALPDSYELLFHQVAIPSHFFDLRGEAEARPYLEGPCLQRAIGVIYRPETERLSHYFHARLPDQFDAIIHLDETRALEPLEITAEWERGEAPETFPFAV
ncbi:MAG TPA: erythromycin esterase family protein [Thermomicrobiales bacterium]|nr:erythromycin esterase family protein [Thermomicrobiales bacterium]